MSTSIEGRSWKQQEANASVPRITDVPTQQKCDEPVTDAEEDPLQVLVDADDEQCMIEEATVFNAKEEKTKEITIEPPMVPARNSLRVSKFLDSLKLNTIETATQSLKTTQSLVYLSSEEDASSSADDFSDYEYESSSEESEQLSIRRSQEVTARVVSVVFVGKPSVIDLSSKRRSVSPIGRPKSDFFSRAVSSPIFDTPIFDTSLFDPRLEHAPRKSSIVSTSDLPTLSTTSSFLNQDPFAAKPYSDQSTTWTNEPSSPYPRTPKTPTFGFHRFHKSISLSRKQSRPNLKAAAAAAASSPNIQTRNKVTPAPAVSSPDVRPLNNPRPVSANSGSDASPTTSAPQSPVTYEEIIRISKRNSKAQLPSQSEPATASKRSFMSNLNANRRRSLKMK
ncbi:hypothetical protein F5Y16DRAFT_45435 [Xylariaceae sp. FL0255]|nr:hypothetical protein F5Y16DRAFT_45435 [Xylariaceae sp. FL0255]